MSETLFLPARLLRAGAFSLSLDADPRPSEDTSKNTAHRAPLRFVLLLVLSALLVSAPDSSARAQMIDHSTGFASHGDLTANGSTAYGGTSAVLTPSAYGQVGSLFSSNKVDVSYFSTSFTFSLTDFAGNGAPGADGIVFIIQNDAPSAIGGEGGDIGYAGIDNSIGVKFDIFQNNIPPYDPSDNCTGLFTDGTVPFGGIDLTPTGVNLRSQNVLRADMTYDGTTLTVKITDTVTGATATQTYAIDIPATVGSTQAYVGFSAATLESWATQQILTWDFSSASSLMTPTLTSLSPSSVAAGSPAFTLTVAGTGFSTGSVVDWNGVSLPTTFVSATQLTASVPASDVTTVGTSAVTVVNPGAPASSPLAFNTTDWNAVAVSAGPSGTGRVLWNRSDGAAGLWVLGSKDTETLAGPTYGPYPGWTATALATANDGTSRVLWTNANGEAGVWTFNASGVETKIGPTYGPYTGWVARAIGVAGDGTSRVLWTNTNGEAGVWSFNTSDVNTLIGPTYGPVYDWYAKSLATAPDGTSRVLWNEYSGASGVWTFGANDTVSVYGTVYGPFTGWLAESIGAAGDGTSRVLWTNVNGGAGVWTFSTADVETAISPTYGPYSGWSASALATASDGTSRVLWTNASRAAGVWTFSANDVQSIVGITYGPF